jgi:hypothetical protein
VRPDALDETKEPGERDWLFNVIRISVHRCAHLGDGGENNDRERAVALRTTERLKDLPTAHSRHQEIEEHEVRSLDGHLLESFNAVTGFTNAESLLPQDLGNGATDVDVIIHNQNRCRHRVNSTVVSREDKRDRTSPSTRPLPLAEAGGRGDVTSTADEGTTFTATLPKEDQALEPAQDVAIPCGGTRRSGGADRATVARQEPSRRRYRRWTPSMSAMSARQWRTSRKRPLVCRSWGLMPRRRC